MRQWNVRFTDEISCFLKHLFILFLYLNIYTCFLTQVNAQELHLNIESEKTISTEFLDSLQISLKHKDYLSLKREVDTIPFLLQRLGYIDSNLEMLQKTNDTSYTARYFFGKKYMYIKVYYTDSTFSKKQLEQYIDEVYENHFILPMIKAETILFKLNSLKTESGNAFSKIRLENIIKNDNELIAQLFIEGGAQRTVDSIAIKGYEKFPRSFLRYYAGVKKGKPFSQKKILSQNDAVDNLGFASSIKPPEALFRKESTTVYFYFQKENDNLFDGILGFATNEETQKLQFNGYLNLELNNNLNFGEQLLINYKADGDDQRNFRVKANLPYLFKSPFGVALELKIFKRDSTFATTEQQARVSYQINPSSTSYVGYKGYESSNLLDQAIAGSSIEDYTSKFLVAGLSFTKLQKTKLFPIKTFIGLDTEIGSRAVTDRKDDQLRFISLINHIFNLNSSNSIYLQNNSSILISDTYLTNELFRFGGINSIRGFNENSIDASLFSVLNTEYRYQFNNGLYAHTIIDLAYFENEILSLKQKLYSFGIGLGLQTKAGLLKLNIANGNTENQTFKFSSTKIHLSLSSRF